MRWEGHPCQIKGKAASQGRYRTRFTLSSPDRSSTLGSGAGAPTVQPSLASTSSGPGGAGATWLSVLTCVWIGMNRHRCKLVACVYRRILSGSQSIFIIIIIIIIVLNIFHPVYN